MDLLTTDLKGNWSIGLGDGKANFSFVPLPNIHGVIAARHNVAVGDVNGDGKMDIVMAIGKTVSVWLNSSIQVPVGTAPVITYPVADSINTTGASLGGNVSSDGGAPITERGIVYAEQLTNSTPRLGGAGVTKVPTSGTTGVFSTNVTGLTVNTAYTFAAYATNSYGTTYAFFARFTTASNPPTLGNYPNASVTAGGSSATITPNLTPTDTTSITATAPGLTDFLTVNPTTGVVRVTNAPVTGSFTVTVKATGTGGSVAKTFTLTVNNPVNCYNTGLA